MNIKKAVSLFIACILFSVCSIPRCIASNPYDSQANFEEKVASNEQIALLYLSCGNVNLTSKNYASALDDYIKALDLLNDSVDSGVEFLIVFGMAITCDNLHLTDLCKRNMARIRALMNAFEDEDDDIEEYTDTENDEVPNYLRNLANMAQSAEVRSTLLLLISDIFPSSSTSYLPMLNRVNSHFFSQEKQYVIIPCKSFLKKLEKLAKNIDHACHKVMDLIERALDIRDRVQGKSTRKKNNV